MMKMNEGAIDRILRVIGGVVILALAFVGPKTAWGYLGLIPLVTGMVGYCPLYAVMGLSTRGAKRLT